MLAHVESLIEGGEKPRLIRSLGKGAWEFGWLVGRIWPNWFPGQGLGRNGVIIKTYFKLGLEKTSWEEEGLPRNWLGQFKGRG